VKQMNCAQEAAVTKAVHTGNWEEPLTAHAATCAVCREIVQTASWMQALARSSETISTLPDASLLWWKARLSEKQAQAEKAQEVSEWVEIASGAAISIALAAWVAWNWFAIQALMTRLMVTMQVWVTAYSTTLLFLPVSAVLCLALAVLTYPILVED
jgi:hypothetical protein